MKEAKKGTCKKCGNYFYVHEHHILPKSKFGKDGETVELCPNCHTHFHEYSKLNNKMPDNASEARRIWNIWLTTVSLTVSVLFLGILLYNIF
jgi:5-methylcytosine-specific restriction endonuclease McrA